jgi:hypothetical protein
VSRPLEATKTVFANSRPVLMGAMMGSECSGLSYSVVIVQALSTLTKRLSTKDDRLHGIETDEAVAGVGLTIGLIFGMTSIVR